MVSAKLLTLAAVASFLGSSQAYPNSYACTPSEWQVGDSINAMGVSAVSLATSNECVISVPESVDACATFTATVQTTVSGKKGIKTGVSGGANIGGDDCKNYAGSASSNSVSVTAPSSGTIKVHAVCGSARQYVRLAVEKEVVVNGNSTIQCSGASTLTASAAALLVAAAAAVMN